MAPLQEELSLAGVVQTPVEVVELVKFMFLSVTLVHEINSAPLFAIF